LERLALVALFTIMWTGSIRQIGSLISLVSINYSGTLQCTVSICRVGPFCLYVSIIDRWFSPA